MNLFYVIALLCFALLSDARPQRRDDDPEPLKLKLVYYKDAVMTVKIGLGTPAQQLNLLVDTTVCDSFVIDTKCTKDNHTPCINAGNFTRSTFDKRASSTFKDRKANYSRNDVVGAAYEVVNDTATVGSVSLTANFGLATMVTAASDWMTADGVFGMGPSLSGAMGPSLVSNVTDVFSPNSTMFTMWLDDFASPNGKGYITVGDYDWVNCENDDLVAAPIVSPIGWMFTMSGISINNYNYKKTFIAQIDSTSIFIQVPQAVMNGIAGVLGATYDSAVGSYFVPCEGTSTLPDLVLSLTGANGISTFNIPNVEYVNSFQGTSRCQVLFNVNKQWENYHYGAQVRLGHPWLRSYCNVFDYKANVLQFTQARHMQ